MTAGAFPPLWDGASERLIAFVRLALAAAALAIVFIDPTQPSRHVPVAYSAFILYALYSAVVFSVSRGRPRPRLALATQVVDLLWVAPVLYFTEGANTPFFPFFVVFTLTAGIRWGKWAAWAVTLYSLLVYTILLVVATPHPLDLNNDLMQLGYFVVVGGLGGYLAEYRQRREAELHVLRAVSETVAAAPGAVRAMGEVVAEARQRSLADAVVGVLRHPESGEPLMVRGRGETRRLSAAEVAPFLEGLAAAPQGERRPRAVAPDGVLLRFMEAEAGLAYPIRAGGDLVGGLFFFAREVKGLRSARGVPGAFLDLLVRQVIPHIETLWVLEQGRETRVAEERRRIARDLHDSFIQVLAGLGLRLKAAGATLAGEAADVRAAAKDLGELHDIVGQELRRVRAYVAEMREPVGEGEALRGLVEETVRAFRARTRIAVALTVDAGAEAVPAELTRELLPLLREALANVEKHARATRVAVDLSVRAGRLGLTVQDDGVGMPPDPPAGFGGHGLASMRERAGALGGALDLAPAAPRGTVLSVAIPIRSAARPAAPA